MDSVVNKLSEIEAAAVSIITNTEVQKKQYEQKISEARELFDTNLSEQTSNTIATIQRDFQEKLEKELQQMSTNSELALKAFQEEYDQYHESYATQIIKRITEV